MPVEIRDTNGGLGNIITGQGIISEEEYVDVLKAHLTQDEEKFKQYRFKRDMLNYRSRPQVNRDPVSSPP
jgi:hypothetical protein